MAIPGGDIAGLGAGRARDVTGSEQPNNFNLVAILKGRKRQKGL